jgi:general secretion pathway protein D
MTYMNIISQKNLQLPERTWRWASIAAALLIGMSGSSCELLNQNAKTPSNALAPTVSVPSKPAAVAAAPQPSSADSTVELSSPPGNDNAKFPGGQKPAPAIVPGTGALAAPIPTSPPSQPLVRPSDNVVVTLNFVDADIRELVKSILGDTLGLTYVIDPNVAGRVTLKTNTPLKPDEMLPTLENILALNGYALVHSGTSYNIVPATDLKDIPLVATRQESGYGLEIIRIHHVSATQLKEALDQYASDGAVRIIDDIRGLIAVAASGPERQRIRELIDVFDVDQLAGMSFGIYPVSAAQPREIIGELEVIFNPTKEPSPNGVLKFLPINRLSAIMVIASRPADLNRAGDWIDRLDHRLVSDQPRLYVHHVQHGQAKQVAATLQAIFGGESTTVEAPPPPSGNVAPNQTPASLSATAPANESGSPPFDDASDAALSAQQGSSFSSSEMPMVTGMPAAATFDATTHTTSKPGKQIRIIADEPNNALFILATPQDFRDIDAALNRLDVEPLQVLIEATIAEVSLNDKLKYGVEWFFRQGNSSIDLAQLASGIPTAMFPGFNYVYAGTNARVIISALDEVTHVNVISSPQLMVLDNRSAVLQVGDEVPVITQSAVSIDDPAAPIVNSVQFRDTGVILHVTPRVNSSGGVELDIEQEVSDVVPTTTSTIDSPTIQQRKIKSSVSVHDGETIALGGLIRDSQSRGKSGIPVLSDIPILGTLFGTKTSTGDRTELLILITPHVVRNPAEADAITEELRKRVQSVLPLERKIQ